MLDATECRAIIAKDPGNSLFPDFADFLRRRKEYDEALRVCLAGLSANPAQHLGRLILARLYYDLGFKIFAIREITELTRQFPESMTIRRLHEALSPEAVSSTAVSAEQEIAEADIDLDDLI